MPYIKQWEREGLNSEHTPAKLSGELNYILTMEAKRYLATHGVSYRVMNEIIGAFEAAKLEFYRRVVAPYEDLKIKENGDVYD